MPLLAERPTSLPPGLPSEEGDVLRRMLLLGDLSGGTLAYAQAIWTVSHVRRDVSSPPVPEMVNVGGRLLPATMMQPVVVEVLEGDDQAEAVEFVEYEDNVDW